MTPETFQAETSWRGRYQPPAKSTDSTAGLTAKLLYADIRELVEGTAKAAESIQEDGRFTDQHRAARVRELAVEAAWQVKGKAEELDDLEAGLQEERAALRRKTVEPRASADAAGQLMDQEIRAVVREMDAEARSRLLRAPDTAPEVLEAVLRAPPLLTGVSGEMYDLLETRAVEARNPEMVKDLDAAEKNVHALRRAVRNGYEILAELVGQDAPLEPRGDRPTVEDLEEELEEEPELEEAVT